MKVNTVFTRWIDLETFRIKVSVNGTCRSGARRARHKFVKRRRKQNTFYCSVPKLMQQVSIAHEQHMRVGALKAACQDG